MMQWLQRHLEALPTHHKQWLLGGWLSWWDSWVGVGCAKRAYAAPGGAACASAGMQ